MNSLSSGFRPRHTYGVLEYEVENDLTLYSPQLEVVHILNPTAAVVWRLCDGKRDVSDISAAISDVYQLEPGVAGEDVRDVLARFAEAGLVG